MLYIVIIVPVLMSWNLSYQMSMFVRKTLADVQGSILERSNYPTSRFNKNTVQVRYLKIIEKSGYQALPWVRYITTAGEYELRMI